MHSYAGNGLGILFYINLMKIVGFCVIIEIKTYKE